MANARKIAIWLAATCGLLLLLYFSLAAIGLAPTPGTRITQTKMRIRNLAGADFEVTDTNTDAFAKEEYISIFASKASGGKESWLSRILIRKTLLFRYDPAMNSPLPVITSSGPSRITIAVPRISSVIFQREKWDNVTINYDIRRIDYPAGASASHWTH